MRSDKRDGVLHRQDLLGLCIRNGDHELLLERHADLDGVQRVESQVVREVGSRRHLRSVDLLEVLEHALDAVQHLVSVKESLPSEGVDRARRVTRCTMAANNDSDDPATDVRADWISILSEERGTDTLLLRYIDEPSSTRQERRVATKQAHDRRLCVRVGHDRTIHAHKMTRLRYPYS